METIYYWKLNYHYDYLIYFYYYFLLFLKWFCYAVTFFYGHVNKAHCCCWSSDQWQWARSKSMKGLTSDHTPLRLMTVQSTAELTASAGKRLNCQLSSSPHSHNWILPTQIKQRLLLVSLPDKSSAAQESHPQVVTIPEQCWRSEQVMKSPAYIPQGLCQWLDSWL